MMLCGLKGKEIYIPSPHQGLFVKKMLKRAFEHTKQEVTGRCNLLDP